MVTGVILGAPTLRVRGDYLAIVTLGLRRDHPDHAINTDWLGGSAGITEHRPAARPSIDGLFADPAPGLGQRAPPLVDLEHKTPFLMFGVARRRSRTTGWRSTVIILVLFADILIKDSRVGRAWEATREDEDAAELMGVPTFRYKLLAFAHGRRDRRPGRARCSPARQGYINPNSFPLLLSMLFVAAVIIGGAGNRWGAILGGVLVAYLPERFRELQRLAAADLRPGADGDRRSSGRRACCHRGGPVARMQAEAEIEALEEGGRRCLRPRDQRRPAGARRALLEVDDVTHPVRRRHRARRGHASTSRRARSSA